MNTSSSLRVSARTRKRVGDLAHRLQVSTHDEVIQRALDQLEQALFWQGFDEEASAYLKAYPDERIERDIYSGTAADRLDKNR